MEKEIKKIQLRILVHIITMGLSCFFMGNTYAQECDLEHVFFPIMNEDNRTVYFVNIDGKRISQYFDYDGYPIDYDEKYHFAIVKKNKKYGLINNFGEEVIPCKYDYLWFKGSDKLVARSNDKYGILSIKNEVIQPLIFDELEWYYQNGYIARVNGQYSFYNHNDQLICSEYGSMKYNENVDLLEVYKKEGKGCGFIDTSGKVIIPLEYISGWTGSNMYYFKDGIAPLEKDGFLYIVDTKGKRKEIGRYEIGGLGDICDNIVKIMKRDNGRPLFGFANTNGRVIAPCKYIEAGDFSDGLAYVRSNSKEYAYINRNGKEVIRLQFERLGSSYDYRFGHGLAPFMENGKFGYINTQGKVVIPPQYDDARVFKDIDVAFVEKDDKWGIIDSHGNEIVNCNWLHWQLIENGNKCLIYNDVSGGVYDLQCKEWTIIPEYNNSVWNRGTLLPNIFMVRRSNNDYGYYDIVKKQEIIPCVYSEEEACWKFVEYCQDLISSDLEKDIPKNSQISKTTFAIIIANEKYTEQGISNVSFATRDGNLFTEYCMKTLGLPEQNIHYRTNATLNQIRSELRWANDIANAFGNEASIIFYYSGHGIPAENGGKAYLLPSDGLPGDEQSAYALSDLYKQLGDLPVKQATVFLDACFSGTQRDGTMLVAAKGVAVKAGVEGPQGNMIVLSASQGDETAYFYKKKRHGLFTYFLVKKLQETKGDVTLGELSEYIKTEVAQYSIVNNGKSQTPSINVSPVLKNNWKILKLK